MTGTANTTTIAGETRAYDTADRHLSTTKAAATVSYTRDATDRIVARTENGTTVRYSHAGGSDSPMLVLDTTGNVLDSTIGLPGGAALHVSGWTAEWSYPNLHGDIVATANITGTKVGATTAYDPYGHTTTNPDTRTGNVDDGLLGTHQRPLEHATGLRPTTEMGARQYDPTLGRFLETDPVEAGVNNPYNYPTDPVGHTDLDGRVDRIIWAGLVPLPPYGFSQLSVFAQGCGSHWWNANMCARYVFKPGINFTLWAFFCKHGVLAFGSCVKQVQALAGGLAAFFGSLASPTGGMILGLAATALTTFFFDRFEEMADEAVNRHRCMGLRIGRTPDDVYWYAWGCGWWQW